MSKVSHFQRLKSFQKTVNNHAEIHCKWRKGPWTMKEWCNLEARRTVSFPVPTHTCLLPPQGSASPQQWSSTLLSLIELAASWLQLNRLMQRVRGRGLWHEAGLPALSRVVSCVAENKFKKPKQLNCHFPLEEEHSKMQLIGEEKQGKKLYVMEPVQRRLFHSRSTMARQPLGQVTTGICCFKLHPPGTGEGCRGRGGREDEKGDSKDKEEKQIHSRGRPVGLSCGKKDTESARSSGRQLLLT